MDKEKEEAFKSELQERLVRIKDVDFVERQWRKFCRSKRYAYFSVLRGHNRLVRGLNRLIHFTDCFYSQSKLMTLQNVIQCEAHREILKSILSEI